MGFRRLVSIYALAIGLALGAGLAATAARAADVARPDMGTAARLAQPDTVLFCINESQTALDVAIYAQKNNINSIDEIAQHIRIGDGSAGPVEQIVERKFATALVTDIFTAIAWVKTQGHPADETPTWTAQAILEACAYEYGKAVAKK